MTSTRSPSLLDIWKGKNVKTLKHITNNTIIGRASNRAMPIMVSAYWLPAYWLKVVVSVLQELAR